MIGDVWRMIFHEKRGAAGVPVQGTFGTRQEAEAALEALRLKLSDRDKSAGAHFSLVRPERQKSLKTLFKRNDAPGANKRHFRG
jgi:hypothetical protein